MRFASSNSPKKGENQMLMNCSTDPNKTLAIARLLLPIGLLVVSFAIAWPHLAPFLHLPPATNDSIQGFCVGLGIALEIGSMILVRKIRNSPRTN
jgi:phosphate/sulfate permease